MIKTTLASLLVMAALLGGCAQRGTGIVTSGSVTPGWESGPTKGLEAPQIKFVDKAGNKRTLKTGYGWVSVIGFLESRQQECCMLLPSLTETANRYRGKAVRVVQISLPTTSCPHGAGCFESCHVVPLRLLALCDSNRAAYHAFGKPADRTVLVIDGNAKVIGVTTIDKIGSLLPQIDRLVKTHGSSNTNTSGIPTYADIY